VSLQVERGTIQSWFAEMYPSLCWIKIFILVWLYYFHHAQLLYHNTTTHVVLKEYKANEFFTLHTFLPKISMLHLEHIIESGYFYSIFLCHIYQSKKPGNHMCWDLLLHNISQSGCSGEEKNLLTLPGIKPQSLSHPAHSPSLYWATPALPVSCLPE
jgi:hypothetical protein